MKKIVIIIIAILLVGICFYEIGIRSFILAPNISEFIPNFEKDGIYFYEDYQEDDFYVKDYYSYEYDILNKEFIVKKYVGDDFGASSRFKAWFSHPKEAADKYKIHEFKKGEYLIYEHFENMCVDVHCKKRDFISNGVTVESKGDFDYSKYITKTNKRLNGKYKYDYKDSYSNKSEDEDAYLELYKDGTFRVYKYKEFKKGTYSVINFKYNIYSESILLEYDDNNTNPIYMRIMDSDFDCKGYGFCKGDLIEIPISKPNSDKYSLDGVWIKEK